MSPGGERKTGTGELVHVLPKRKQIDFVAEVLVVGSHEADGGAPVLGIAPDHAALYQWTQAAL